MSQSSDGIVGGPAPRGEAASDSDGIVPGPLAAGRGGGRARGKCMSRPRAPPTTGRFSSLLFVDRRLGPPLDDIPGFDAGAESNV